MQNIPEVRLGIIAVSRDCFPIELSQKRRKMVVEACQKGKTGIIEIQTTVENERDVLQALREIEEQAVNALVIYLGNFGPEGPTTMLAQKFDGPVMFAAAAEESTPQGEVCPKLRICLVSTSCFVIPATYDKMFSALSKKNKPR